jgi:hypothetical protein
MAPAMIVFAAGAQTPAPEPAERSAIVSRMQEAARAYADRLQNFTCTQFLVRSAGNSPDGPHWKKLDTQEAELDYVDRKEHYTLLRVDGQATDATKRIKQGPYLTPGGEFGAMLQKIFTPQAQAGFEWDHEEADGAARSCVFRYKVSQATSTEVIRVDGDSVRVGHHGMVWADCETGSVKQFRLESDFGEVQLKRAGPRFPVGFQLDVHYAPVAIGAQEFLLPHTVEETSLFDKTWTRVEIRFEQYRKYDANSVNQIRRRQVTGMARPVC